MRNFRNAIAIAVGCCWLLSVRHDTVAKRWGSRGQRHRGQGAQSVVEFSLVAPFFFAMLFGLIGVGWLFFQSAAISDAARGAAREATIETSLSDSSGCESGTPLSIQKAAQNAANIVPVDQNPLCTSSGSATTLVQAPTAGNTAQLTVYAFPPGGLAHPGTIKVTVAYKPLPFTFASNLTFTASSTLPTLS